MFEVLFQLREAVEARSQATLARYPDWPCRKGCDHCCRSLAQWPELSTFEWKQIETGLRALPAEVRAKVEERRTARPAGPPYPCPYLDAAAGACLIYEHRPIACRAYGFYVDDRGMGLYCGIIREKVEAGELDAVVWGNHAALEARVEATLGPPSPEAEPRVLVIGARV